MRWKHPRDGDPTSECGRFRIIPIYRSTVKPDGYWLEDRAQRVGTRYVRHSCSLVRDAKALAESIVRAEQGEHHPGIVITDDML